MKTRSFSSASELVTLARTSPSKESAVRPSSAIRESSRGSTTTRKSKKASTVHAPRQPSVRGTSSNTQQPPYYTALHVDMDHHLQPQPAMVVINSLLCFIRNYRQNPRLRDIVAEYFSKTAINEAQLMLLEKANMSSRYGAAVCDVDLVDLFDSISNKYPCLQFAAADLTCLPLSLLMKDDQNNEILRELKSLRTFMTNALDGKLDDTPQSRESETPSVRCKLNTSASSPEFPMQPSVPTSQVLPVVCASSPKPAYDSLPIGQTPPPPPTSLPSSAVAAANPPPSSHASTAYDEKAKANGLKRKGVRSLDDAVKMLAEKRKAEQSDDCALPIPSATSPAAATMVPQRPPAMNLAATWQHYATTAAASPEAHDYIKMLRLMRPNIGSYALQQLHAVSSPSPAPEVLETPVKDDHHLGDDKMDESGEDGDSSPSPSEDNKDEHHDANTENDADKPFICEHVNCQKRFANKFLLKKHQFIHTGLRPHTCPFCNKRFNRKDNLLRHKKTHLQAVPGEPSRIPEAITDLFPNLSMPLTLESFGVKLEDDE